MKYLILVSHGEFAEGLQTSLEMFAGEASSRSFALCLHNGESAADFGAKVTKFLAEKNFKNDDEFVILADIIGGSPLTTFLNLFSAHGLLPNAVILGGMNFSMALTAAVSLDTMSQKKLAAAALSEGKKAMQLYQLPPSTADSEDEI